MKTLTTGAVMTALMMGSGLAQAATTTSSIPMSVNVPKVCVLSDISAGIILPEDGSEVQGAVTLTCNLDGGFHATYSLDSRTNHTLPQVTNSNGVALPISASVHVENWDLILDQGAKTLNYNYSWTGRPSTAVVKAKLRAPTTALTPAGVYTDTFRVNVTY